MYKYKYSPASWGHSWGWWRCFWVDKLSLKGTLAFWWALFQLWLKQDWPTFMKESYESLQNFINLLPIIEWRVNQETNKSEPCHYNQTPECLPTLVLAHYVTETMNGWGCKKVSQGIHLLFVTIHPSPFKYDIDVKYVQYFTWSRVPVQFELDYVLHVWYL